MPLLKSGDLHLIFNGQSRLLKAFELTFSGIVTKGFLPCHDVGVNDANIAVGEDEYGHLCKCPPGKRYLVGTPVACATKNTDGTTKINHPDDKAYGFWFTPLGDDPDGDFAKHGRAGIGMHGGGSDLPDPFADKQGWEYTLGCLRLQNDDNALLIGWINNTHATGGRVFLDVNWNTG